LTEKTVKTVKKLTKQKITPFLWFDENAEEAAKFYVSVFKKSKILAISRYGKAAAKASGKPEGSVMTVQFQLEEQEFVALNGGPQFKFTEAISLFVSCKTQAELDRLWKKLLAGGQEISCGWLKDKYGLAWQLVPADIIKMLSGKDTAKADRVMSAVVQMNKLDIKTLKKAYKG
jgi:predicted 3-demethylubiquinone-9 3-methyltransferase (glyoxalase superfamily)